MENINLDKYNAKHLLAFYDELEDNQKEQLLEDIKTINFEEIKAFYNQKDDAKKKDKIEPLKAVKKDDYSEEEIVEIFNKGAQIIRDGKYAVVTMAGGQGTRLGHTGPKGTFKLNLKDKDRYIFEIFIDGLKEAYKKYNVYLSWYIMTSKDNNNETIQFFEQNNYFGYPKEKIHFFTQGELPITDLNGNLVLEKKDKVFKAADGNGGVFNALSKNSIIDELNESNVEWVLITGIDNILVNLADEFYIGLVDSENKLNGVKSVAKTTPEEKVGVFCKRNGKPSVIEYSEMDDDMRYATYDEQNLIYSEANIVNHLLNIKVLEKVQNEKLPVHKAIKKLNYIDKDGNNINSNECNSIKYEAFIFDYFNMVDDVTVYRVSREKEFAPVKNKEGADSPKTAIELYNNLYFKEV